MIRNFACLCFVGSTDTTLANYDKLGRNIIAAENLNVSGKLITVSKSELARLDRYERVPSKYKKIKVLVNDEKVCVYQLQENNPSPKRF